LNLEQSSRPVDYKSDILSFICILIGSFVIIKV
jgi:hypothetical protein